MFSLLSPSDSVLLSVHYSLIVWRSVLHDFVCRNDFHNSFAGFSCYLLFFFSSPFLSFFFFLSPYLSELCLDVLCTKGLQRAQDMFVAGEIFCPGSHSNRQHQLPEAHCLHTLLLHSFSLFLFSEELLLMSTHQQTKQMGWWKMNN